MLVPKTGAPTVPQRSRISTAWNWLKANPVQVLLFASLVCAAEIGAVILALQVRRARTEANEAREEARRGSSELWTTKLNEARALRTAGGPGARLRSAALLQSLLQRPTLADEQILSLREEAIAQMALMDIAPPTNWLAKSTDKKWAWNHTLDRYAKESSPGRIDLCEFPSERVVASFHVQPRATLDQAIISRDNQFLAARFGNAGGNVRVWRIDNQELLLQTTGTSIDLSPDGRTLLLVTADGVASQPLSQGSEARLLQGARLTRKAVFSPDSQSIAVLPANRDSVEIWDAASGDPLASFSLSFNPQQVAWHPDGSRLLLGGSRGQVEMRVLKGGIGADYVGPSISLAGHVGEVRQLTFTPDGSAAVSAAWDYSSIAWDAVSGRRLFQEERMLLQNFGGSGDRVGVRREAPLSESVTEVIPRIGYRTVAWAGAAGATEGVWNSPDGRLGVVNCASKSAQVEGDCLLWDNELRVEIARFKGVWAQFSPDSRTLFTFERYAANRVRRYDVSPEAMANRPGSWWDGTNIYQGRGGEKVNTGTISADGRTLAVATTDRVVFLNARTGATLRSWKAPAHHVTLSQNGKWAATSRHHSPSVLRLAQNGQPLLSLEKYSRVRFSPDSRWMAVASQDKITVYELESLRHAYAPILLDAGSGGTPPIEFSSDGLTFSAAHNRSSVRLYETASGRELATLSPPNPAPITGGKALEFTADGRTLLAARNDGETIAWNLPQIRDELARLGLDWSVSSATNPAARSDPVITQQETNTPLPRVSKPLIFSGRSAGLAFSRDGERLTSGSAIWSALNGRLLLTTDANARNGRPAFSPDGNSIANGLEILDAHNGAHLTCIDPGFAEKKVYGVAFSPDGKRFAVGKGDWEPGDVKVFNLPDGETVHTFTNHSHPVWDVAFSPDGKSLATASGRWQEIRTGGGPGEARVWDLSAGKSNHVHTSAFPLYTVAFSGDGRRFAAGGGAYHVGFKSLERGEMKVWDVTSGEEIFSAMRLPSCVYSLALSPDGKHLVAGIGEEGEQGPFDVKLWDVESGQEILTLGQHKKSVRGVAFSANGKRLASGSTDGVIQIWNVE